MAAPSSEPPPRPPATSNIPAGRAADMWDPPSGLRAGSPPFPPPRLIRPTVRLLPRSPRFRVRVPINTCSTRQKFPVCQAAAASVSVELLKFGQDVAADAARDSERPAHWLSNLPDVSVGQHQIEMICPVGFLSEPDSRSKFTDSRSISAIWSSLSPRMRFGLLGSTSWVGESRRGAILRS